MRREAAAWVVRLSDPSASADDRARFEAWRAGSPERELAYERELAGWEALDGLRDAGGLQAAPRRRFGFAPRWATAAAAALLMVGVAWWSAHPEPAYATAIGERRLVVLEDGSRVEMNTDSRIVVRYSGERREVRLLRGEALFMVTADPRPFVVDADIARVVANDSRMNVRRHDAAATVTVTGGNVAVSRSDADSTPPPAVLQQRQEGWFAADGVARKRPVTDEDLRRLLAWQHGAIVLDGRSLVEIAEEFNRYNQRKLIVVDPAIAELRLAGYFRSEDLDGFVAAVTDTFPVNARPAQNGSIQLGRRG